LHHNIKKEEMNKILTLTIGLMFASSLAFSQSIGALYLNAYNYWDKGGGELDKAHSNIEKAVKKLDEGATAKTKQLYKVWLYRGHIYFSIYGSKNPTYKALHENPLDVMADSYEKMKKYGDVDADVVRFMRLGQNFALNDGVAQYNEKAYDKALSLFKTAVKLGKMNGMKDSLALYNCALASEKIGNSEEAVKYYKECIALNYKAEDMYYFAIFALREAGKDDEANAMLAEGIAAFPKSQNLIISQLNNFLKDGKNEEAEQALQQALKNDPNNPVLYFSIGSVYDNLKKFEAAEKAYLKALEMDAKYFDALYNLGALYFNHGVELNQKINDITDVVIYEKEKKKADAKFQEALPYLEKALDINPNDRNTLLSLKQLYARMSMQEKYDEVNAKLQN
jgi:tetratricopeptide (TPR) repeat protein